MTYLRQAGAKAANRSAHREAISCFEQSTRSAQASARKSSNDRARYRYSYRHAELAPAAWRTSKSFRTHARGGNARWAIDDKRRLGQISAYLSGYFVQAGDDPTQAIEKGELAFMIASAIGDFNLQVQANHFLGTSHRMIGDYDRAIYHFKKNVDSLVGDQIYDRFGLAFPRFCRVALSICRDPVGPWRV